MPQGTSIFLANQPKKSKKKKEERLYPLQVFLKEIFVQSNVNSENVGDMADALQMQNLKQLLKYAIIVVPTVPLFAFYPFVQKHFVKGVTLVRLKDRRER